jgi:hypothetical protein
MLYSGFSSDKGKGKAKDSSPEPEIKESSNSGSKTETGQNNAQLERDTELAIYRSIHHTQGKDHSDLGGESSNKSLDSSIQEDLYNLKALEDILHNKKIEFNTKKMVIDAKNITEKTELEELGVLKEHYNSLSASVTILKEKLASQNVNYESENEGGYDSQSDNDYYSDSDRYSNSSTEEKKPVKRVKYSDDTKPFLHIPVTAVFFHFISPSFNFLILFVCGFIIYFLDNYVLELLVFPFGINIKELMSICIYINILMLISKCYKAYIKLYGCYIRKEYIVITTNIVISIILIILYIIIPEEILNLANILAYIFFN